LYFLGNGIATCNDPDPTSFKAQGIMTAKINMSSIPGKNAKRGTKQYIYKMISARPYPTIPESTFG